MEGENLEEGANLTATEVRQIAPVYLKITQEPDAEVLHYPHPGSGDCGTLDWGRAS
jgi:hypothetical protein